MAKHIFHTMAQAEWLFKHGGMTQAEWDGFEAIWLYSAPRFSNIAGQKFSITKLNAALDAGQNFIVWDAGTPEESRQYFSL